MTKDPTKFEKQISADHVEADCGFWFIYQQNKQQSTTTEPIYSTEQPEPQLNYFSVKGELKTPDDILSELDEQLAADESRFKELLAHRGGCRCFISAPCGACCTPLTLQEATDLGWYEPLNLELMVRREKFGLSPEDVKP